MKYKALLCLTVVLTYYQGAAQTRPKPLDEKVHQLTEMLAKKSIINLNLNKFKEFVKSPPKDYSFIVMFTAMAPGRRCAICQHVYDEYLIVANSFRFSPSYNNKLYFGMVDFDEGSDIFQMLRLNTAPVIMHFPAKGKPKPADSMDFERSGIHAEAIAKWIQDRTDVPVRIFRPPNYAGALAFTFLFSLGAAFLYIRRNHLEFLYNKELWAILSLGVCFTMVSGQMWNQIRGPPFFHRSKNGPVYINAGSHGQFILESYIVAALKISVGAGEAAGEHSLQQPHLSCAETASSIHTLLTPINSAEIVPTPCQILKIMLYAFWSYKGPLMRLLESTCSLESSLLVLHNDAAVVVGLVLMIEAAGGVKQKEVKPLEGKRRRFQSVVGLVLVCVFFSLLLSVFRAKTQGYPYSFLFK